MSAAHSTVYYFGDSLTDASVLTSAYQQAFFEATGSPFAPPLPNFGAQNAVSDAFTHVEYTRQVEGFEAVNFAVAGARALGIQQPFLTTLGSTFDSNLTAQVERFKADTAGGVPAGAAAFLLIGSNDFSAILAANTPGGVPDIPGLIVGAVEGIGQLLDALEGAARELAASGVETVYFGTLPKIDFFPAFDGGDADLATIAGLVTEVYNTLLEARADALRADGIEVRMVDVAALSDAITEDATSIGILAPRSEFLNGDVTGFDADQVGYWDGIHPSEAVHKAWGAYSAFVMQGGETETLSSFSDFTIQGGADDLILALGGNDKVFAGGGDDIVLGGTGNDRINLGWGDDIASGGTGDDRISGSWGDDILAGQDGDDHLFGGAGRDVLIGGTGSDFMKGGWGNDTFVFAENALIGGTGTDSDQINGGWGYDTLYLVLSDPTFEAYSNGSLTLGDLGLSTRSVERVEAINGRDAIEPTLGTLDWYQDADLWGLV